MAATVLVADDSPTIQNKAKGILTGEGLEVITVSNGVAAVKELSQIKPSLILADVSMPGRDGYEVCEYVKKSAELNRIPVLLLFSDTDPYDEVQGARVGADGTVRKMVAGKPLDPQGLISTVNRFLAQAETPTPTQEDVLPPPPSQEFQISSVPTEMEIPTGPKEVVDLSALPEEASLADAVFEPHASFTPESAAVQEEAAQPAELPLVTTSSLDGQPSAVESESSEGERPILTTPDESLAPGAPSAESQEPSAEGAPEERVSPQPSFESEVLFHTPPEVLDLLSGGRTRTEATNAAAVATDGEPSSVTGSAASLDANLIYKVVLKVVIKMSPSDLPSETANQLASKLASEIISEIGTS